MSWNGNIEISGQFDAVALTRAIERARLDFGRLDLGLPVIVNKWAPPGVVITDGSNIYASPSVADDLQLGVTPMPRDQSNDRGPMYEAGRKLAQSILRVRYPGSKLPSEYPYSALTDKAQPWSGQIHAVDGRVWDGARWIGFASDSARSKSQHA
jgi:hypothetical protein